MTATNTLIREAPRADNLSRTVEQTLQAQVENILDTYIVGNKSTARAMLSQIPYERRYYCALYMLQRAALIDQTEAAYRLICSVTR